MPTPHTSFISTFSKIGSKFSISIKLVTPDCFFFAMWFATLLKVFVFAIPMLVGIPVHCKTVSLISFPTFSTSLSGKFDKSKKASSIE